LWPKYILSERNIDKKNSVSDTLCISNKILSILGRKQKWHLRWQTKNQTAELPTLFSPLYPGFLSQVVLAWHWCILHLASKSDPFLVRKGHFARTLYYAILRSKQIKPSDYPHIIFWYYMFYCTYLLVSFCTTTCYHATQNQQSLSRQTSYVPA